MQRYLKANGFECIPVEAWWQDFTLTGGRHAPNETVRSLEQAYKFRIVLSCVDKNEPRHALQNVLPQLIVGGSTDGLAARASIFDLGANTSCLKCHNPLQVRNAIIQERIAELQGLTGEERSARARDFGLSDEDVTLLLSPGGCGKLSESDLDRFAAGAPEMSVGFVSAAAGVLLVAQFLRYLRLGAGASTASGSTAVATFARAKLRVLQSGTDHACGCESALRARWSRNWPRSYRP
jgi:molybdopterin/thiamine biosynthesis adenylyltransferase